MILLLVLVGRKEKRLTLGYGEMVTVAGQAEAEDHLTVMDQNVLLLYIPLLPHLKMEAL